ncbi:TBA1 protein, partial [Amia calva]|nr:TBA1 protein [Amia calva]
LRQGHRCVPWNPFPVDYWTDPRSVLRRHPSPSSRSLTVCSNHSGAAALLRRVDERVRVMLHSRAYLHWYQRYGCEESDFLQALDTLKTVEQEYSVGARGLSVGDTRGVGI